MDNKLKSGLAYIISFMLRPVCGRIITVPECVDF